MKALGQETWIQASVTLRVLLEVASGRRSFSELKTKEGHLGSLRALRTATHSRPRWRGRDGGHRGPRRPADSSARTREPRARAGGWRRGPLLSGRAALGPASSRARGTRAPEPPRPRRRQGRGAHGGPGAPAGVRPSQGPWAGTGRHTPGLPGRP